MQWRCRKLCVSIVSLHLIPPYSPPCLPRPQDRPARLLRKVHRQAGLPAVHVGPRGDTPHVCRVHRCVRAAARPVPCSQHHSIPPLHPAAHPLYMCRCTLSQLLCGTLSSAGRCSPLLAAGHALLQTQTCAAAPSTSPQCSRLCATPGRAPSAAGSTSTTAGCSPSAAAASRTLPSCPPAMGPCAWPSEC